VHHCNTSQCRATRLEDCIGDLPCQPSPLEGPVGKKRTYRVHWRFNGQRPRKSLGSTAVSEARRRRDEIAETLRLIETGRLETQRARPTNRPDIEAARSYLTQDRSSSPKIEATLICRAAVFLVQDQTPILQIRHYVFNIKG
jgi:hypothetical protein